MPKQELSLNIRFLSAISYIGFLFLLPLFLLRKSEFAQFHARQGFVLFMTGVVLSMVAFVPLFGFLIALIGWPLLILIGINGIVQAAYGKKWIVPILGEYAQKIRL